MLCAHDGCSAKVAKYTLGKCPWCNENHCMKHRHPESHVCSQIKKQYQRLRTEQGTQLLESKVVMSKIQPIYS
jgi:predicted nucleic acid binding AN1-type Zn finger protein